MSLSAQDWSISHDETSTRLSRLFRKPPVFLGAKGDTTSSILDMSLYGASKGESVSPMSSAIAASSMDDDDNDVEGVGVSVSESKEIGRLSEVSRQKGHVLVVPSVKTASISSESTTGVSEVESRDDVESTQNFVHDIFIIQPKRSMDLGIVLNDALCPATHPVVAFVHGDSILCGRLGEGDFLIEVNNVSVRGGSASVVMNLIDQGLSNGVTALKITVLSAKAEMGWTDSAAVHGLTLGSVSAEV